jgi:ribosome-associated protein
MRRNIHAEDYKSKAQIKREAQLLEDMGRAMIRLNPALLKKLPLPEYILDAVLDAQKMKQGALKRQVQYIERLLREEEELDLAALQRALAAHLK